MAEEVSNISVDFLRRQLLAQKNADQRGLQHGGGGGTYDDMSGVTREELDAKLNATETRIESSLKVMTEKLSHLPTTFSMVATMAAFAVASVTLVLAILAFAGDRFDGGFNVGASSIDRKLGIEQIARENTEQTRQIQTLSSDLNQVLDTLKAISANQSLPTPPTDNPPQ